MNKCKTYRHGVEVGCRRKIAPIACAIIEAEAKCECAVPVKTVKSSPKRSADSSPVKDIRRTHDGVSFTLNGFRVRVTDRRVSIKF